MKAFLQRHLTIAIIGIAIVVGGIGFVGALKLSSPQQSKSPVKTQCDVTCVDLYSDRATPDTITITTGSYIQFNSKDNKPHALAIGDDASSHHSAHAGDGAFSSGVFQGDEAWRVQFKDPGSYIFHDEKNPKVEILVVVYTPGKDYTKIQ